MPSDDTDDAPPEPPARLRELPARLTPGDELRYTFEDAWVDVPSRFDRPGRTATWGLDGTVTIRVEGVEE